jgi:DNA-binding XRE family transcriptional regulator
MVTLTFSRGRAKQGTFQADMAFCVAARAELGLTQAMVAALCGRSLGVYVDYERGRYRLPLVMRRRLLELLQWKRTGVAPSWATPFEGKD